MPNIKWRGKNRFDQVFIEFRLWAKKAKDIAADSRNHHILREGLAQAIRHGDEHGVAKILIQNAVDVGKAVDINNRQHVSFDRTLVDARQEAVAVGKIDQLVFVGQRADPLQQLGVFEGRRDVAAKDFDQIAIKIAERVADVDVGGDGKVARNVEVKAGGLTKRVVALFQ